LTGHPAPESSRRKLLLAAAASVALAFPALAQTTTQPTPPPATLQIQPNDQAAHPAMQTPPGANMQAIAPNMLSQHQVRQIQQALDKNGFSAGRADGIWGPETRSALIQKPKNMGAANGELNDETLAALDLNPGQFAQGQRGAPPMGKTP
jgi:peptidoglycan hydrolase-like protein with peptidoglycan-binding domain